MSDRQGSTAQPETLTRRQRQAQQTRTEILNAARRLFVEQGYAATTINDIAATADVAVQTIYSSVGSKAELLIELLKLARHSAEIPAMDRRRDDATAPLQLATIGARLHRQLMERAGDILRLLAEAAPADPDVRTVWDRTMQSSRSGAHEAMKRLAELGGLAPGLDVETATDIAFVLGHPKLYLELQDLGWSHDQIERWLVEITTKALIDSGLLDGES